MVHLESGADVLIVRGTADDIGTPAMVPAVVAALTAKYTRAGDSQYLPGNDPDFDAVYAIRPQSAMAWRAGRLCRLAAPVGRLTGLS